ncbi:multiple PDZ domain protein-like isoform X3 [Anticarsia gemmatalis]|uniref:multiple PDZ domain protein-like isoform X3 n=1 Tax=Anticarsia gemmatalis TaxID=129554 RepID=UPI003F771638
MQVFGEWAQVEVVELVNDGSGLAFGIVGGRSSGVVVKSVLPGGVADRDGRLRSGDMLLRIGAVSVVGMCARQAAAVLRQCGACVRLLVARPASSAPDASLQPLGASPAPIIPSRLLADPIELERRLSEAGHDGFGALCEDTSPPSPPPTIIEERLHHRPVASMVAVVPRGALAPSPRPPALVVPPPQPQPQPVRLPLDMAVRGTGEPETLSYDVQLNKDSALGLGITVAGYVCEQEELSGIFVKSISEGSSADLCGKIQVNDRIVEVDGVSLHGVTNHRAVALLRDAKGPVVRLKALRYLRGAGFEKLQKALAAQDGRRSPIAPPSPSVTSLAKYSFSVYDESTVIEVEPESEILPHLPSPTSPSEEAEIVIGRDDEVSEREARRIQDKWRDILRNEPDWPGHQYQYDIVCGTIIKERDSGLGISLEGTVRVVGGKEVQARHYIRAIAPNGPVARLGMYRVGDELLEVNGWRVLGAHHVEVVTRLRAVTSPVSLVVVRKRDQLIGSDRMSDSGFARSNILGGSLQDLLSPPQRLIKAKSESSVASLCSATTVMSAGHDHDEFCTEDLERVRSRSLEPLSGLAMWSDHVEYIQLLKEDRGLGFSILDYLDPSEPGSSVIVVRSVVVGGAAAADGRLSPGDRLVSVNGVDVARAPLARAVGAIKTAPKGIVTIGIAKPLPCSTVVGGERANGPSMQSSQECINSLASDDHTGMDSFHECLQEYGEGLEVVQICLEPEEASIKDEELSALGDLSFDDYKRIKKEIIIEDPKEIKVNGVTEMKSSKSDDSLDDHDDDMTITEDDILVAPRELPDTRSKSADRKDGDGDKCLSKQQSKEISTSDEMVFAVTPTGLERISFDKYWKDNDVKIDSQLEKVKSDESWKECLNSPIDDTVSFYDATTRISVQEENNSLLYIDHEIDGYETCLDEDSSSQKCNLKSDRKMNGDTEIKEISKQEKIAFKNKDNDVSAKIVSVESPEHTGGDDESYGHPYVQEHIIKQMKSLRIEPLNINICTKKKKRSPTKPSKHESPRIQCVEYYNDQAECLKEIRQKKLEEEEKKHKEEQKKILQINLATMEKKVQKVKLKQQASEDSTDAETNYDPSCHKCFLENYAYAITQAYMAEANACKYCEVIREMLEVPKNASRRGSAPALVNLDSGCSETDDEDLLMVPVVKDRRKSAGPLKFPMSSRRPSFAPPSTMTVTVSSERRSETLVAQRWGSPRQVTLKRCPGAPLGVSIVGGKVDIISNREGEDGEEKAIFGIFIKNVVPDSPAGNSGQLQTGDRILEVDGACVRSAQHERAVQLIKAAGDTVTLTVQSLLAWNTDSSDVEATSPPASPTPSARKSPAPPPPQKTPQHEIKITVTSETDVEKEAESASEKQDEKETPAEPKPVYSDSESSDEEDERELQGRTCSDKGVEIDRASAAAVKRTKEEKEADPEEEDDFGYTTNKIRKKYAGLGDSVLSIRLERSPRAGLGLSLAGHRDRSKMAVFVCGLHPAGAAAKASPPVKVGDEILEVNGIVLHGRCHLNASAIIKGLMGPVFKIILLRRKAALEDVAVKPLTPAQFPVALEEEKVRGRSSEDRFAGYKGVRDITVKKGPSGLGIMIIEGRHTEAGRGIFVSDLQEGSAAEQGGLQIGDMLLAVNRDSLLNCSYDAAAAKLKQTEGVVVLTVCTPNLKDDKDDSTATTPGTPGAPPSGGASRPASRNADGPGLAASRPQTPRPVPSPVKAEPPPDPSTAPVEPNKDTVIEISSNNEVLGVKLLGGSDTLINGASAIILDIYTSGVIAKDGRLKVGDQILDCNGVTITKEMAHERLCLSIKQKTAKLKMTVHRPDPIKYEEVEVDLSRKGGKPLGLTCVAPVQAPGVYIGELLPGSPAELDGRIQKGDFLIAVDGKDVSTADLMGAAAALKLCSNKATIKVKRFKSVR